MKRMETDLRKLMEEGEELWEQVKSASYKDFWGAEGFGGSPTELLHRCWNFCDKVEEFEQKLRERAESEGMKEAEGTVIAVKVGEVDVYDDDGRCYAEPIFRYLRVSEGFLQSYDKVMELRNKIEWKLTENRFIE